MVTREHPAPDWSDVVLHGHVHDRGDPLRWDGSTLVSCLCVELWRYRPVQLSSLSEVYWRELNLRP